MNCYLETKDEDDVNCTRIRTQNSTTLLINVSKKDTRRPDEYYTEADSVFQDPEILYTAVTDTCDVEQGQGGFVHSIKAMHDSIADDQTVPVRKNSNRNRDLTEQIETFMPELGGSAKKRVGSSWRGTPPRDEMKVGRVGSSSGTPREEIQLSRASSSASSTCDEISPRGTEFIRAESEIVYTLSDVTDVEQGHAGFVKTLKEKHESIGVYKPERPASSLDGKPQTSKDKPYPV